MTDTNFALTHHAVLALAPDADRFNGNPATDVISLGKHSQVLFLLTKGTGAVGTADITIESCDTVVPGIATAIPFSYRVCTEGDTWGEWQAATTDGFKTTAGENQQYEVLVNAAALNDEDEFIRLQITEDADGAVDAGVSAILIGPRYSGSGSVLS